MTDTQDDCRRAFEDWADTCADGRGWDLSENADGSYECEGVQDSWLAFQAAWSSRPQPNVDELVREIVADEFWVEESAKHYAVIEVNSVIALIRKWAEGGK